MSATEEAPPAAPPALMSQPSIGSVSTHVRESAVIDAPQHKVWTQLANMTFEWWGLVSTAEACEASGPNVVGGCHTLTFADGTTWMIELREVSLTNHSLGFDVITSSQDLTCSSITHTFTVHSVTSSGQSYFEWETNFSNDATLEVVEDSRFKKLDAFNDLAAHMARVMAADAEAAAAAAATLAEAAAAARTAAEGEEKSS
mmetsp:Transcript_31953/g.63364  ORF Transcript_31953/g.63364 Transcript_31953/m.63364 type:complete len:201 (-) Transcript_31953:57-659(-)